MYKTFKEKLLTWRKRKYNWTQTSWYNFYQESSINTFYFCFLFSCLLPLSFLPPIPDKCRWFWSVKYTIVLGFQARASTTSRPLCKANSTTCSQSNPGQLIKPQFPYKKNENNNNIYFIVLLWDLEIMT